MKGILTIMVLVAVLCVSVQYAEAEQLILEGENKKNGIFISIEGKSNIMMWETSEGYSEHFDSKLKIYKSGGFSIKNVKDGIAVWGHPLSDTQYKLVILTIEGVSRIVADVISMNPVETVTKSGAITERIEPKSSIGADITKWDIPTDTVRDSDKARDFILAMKPNVYDTKITLGDIFEFDGKVYNAKTSRGALEDATVLAKIIRDDYVIREQTVLTKTGGMFHLEFVDMDYPEFYPTTKPDIKNPMDTYCYKLNLDIQYGNHTMNWIDRFIVMQDSGIYNKVFVPDMTWLNSDSSSYDKYKHLPGEFEKVPRDTTFEDRRCNSLK